MLKAHKILTIAVVALAAIAVKPLDISAEDSAKVWCMVTNQGMKIPVTSVDYIVQEPGASTFSIVTTGGVYDGVSKTTFELVAASDGVDTPDATDGVVIGPFRDKVSVMGLKEGAEVSVFNSQGIKMTGAVSVSPNTPTIIDVSQYPAGIYIVKTSTTTAKFLKE